MFRGSHLSISKSLAQVMGVLLWPPILVFVLLLCSTGLSAQTVLVGDQTIESNIDTNAKGLAEAFPATASATGQVGSINFFLDETSTATKIYFGIYKDASGHPGSLLTQGSTTQFALGTWNSVTLTSVTNIDPGPTIWFVDIVDENGAILTSCGHGTSCSATASSASAAAHQYTAQLSTSPTSIAGGGPTSTTVAVTWH